MKILHVISNLEIGGAQRVRLELVRQMLAHGVDNQEHLIVYFHDGPMRTKFENLGIKTEHVPVRFWDGGWSMWCKLSKILHAFAPDVLHSQLWLANIFARLLAYKNALPVICDLHSMTEINGFWKNLFERFFPIGATEFVAVSDAVANDFAQKFGIQSTVIKNGVDSGKFRFSFAAREELRAELKIPENAFVVGAVGRFDAIKKFDNLIHAYALMLEKMQTTKHVLRDNCYLVLVGEGKLKASLQYLVQELGLSERVIFSSSLRSMYRYYSIFDCLAISSRSEGLSVAMLEALFSGLQVVCTAPAAQHDIIIDGKNGFLVPFGESQIMADRLLKIATKFDAEFVERPSRIDYDFDAATMAKNYQLLYLDVLKKFNNEERL